MNKKEYILKILETVKNDWELARWLAIITVNQKEDSKILDLIFNLLKESLKDFKNSEFKEKIKNSMKTLKEELLKEKQEISEELLNYEKELENL